MFGLDEQIASLGDGSTLLLVIVVAILLGLRHATDPDHLAAVSVLMASDEQSGARRAGRLGFGWGLGHATALLACGLPVVLASAYLPERVQQATEFAVGVLIAALALRLLVRWRRGHYHAHAHWHGSLEHRHLHPHDGDGHGNAQGDVDGAGHGHGRADDRDRRHRGEHVHVRGHHHDHDHEPVLGRSPVQAYGIGLLHGIGGSAGVTVLLLAGIADERVALLALVLFALGTAFSMFALSWGLGYALTRGRAADRALALTPAMSILTLAFGLWYALGALDVVSYTL